MKDKLKEILFSLAIGVVLILLSILMLVGFLLLSLYISLDLFPIMLVLIMGVLGYFLGNQIYKEWKK
jgi:hypothetical protein